MLRYVSGESPLAEAQAICEWLDADRDFAASVAELQAAWNQPATPTETWDKAGVWNRISEQMRSPRQSGPVVRQRRVVSTRKWQWPVGIAAAAVLMLTLVRFGARPDRNSVEPVTYREVKTARGQQAVLDLPDGSRVTLAADSKLRIPSNFDVATRTGRRRELQLIGRGYFEVTHDSTRPFLVHTATATTEDIGTAFVVSAYPEVNATQVVVAEGSVALHQPAAKAAASAQLQSAEKADARPLMMLEPGDIATLDSNGTATLRRHMDVARYTSWTKGVLTFDSVRLRDAIPEMERWYDIEIRLADAQLGNRRITVQLQSEPARFATERLKFALGVEARAKGRLITLALPH